MRIIGLTGGIASGKSLVSQLLADLGAVVIDADKLGHEVYQPGTPGHREVVETFGEGVVAEDGSIDRKKLGPIVFADQAKLDTLNRITRPRMRALTQERFAALRGTGTPVAVLEAAILLEAGWDDMCDEVWAVEVEPELAVERLMGRNGMNREAALARIKAQLSNEERGRRAQVVIQNNGTVDDLRRQVERRWTELQQRLTVAAR